MEPLPLPPGSRLIHIGPQKTGTTIMQGALNASRTVLSEYGVQYGGKWHRPRRAGWAIGLPGRTSVGPPPPMRSWKKLVRDVRRAPGRIVVVSNEDFGAANDAQADRIVSDLGGSSAHVVMVARRLDRLLPSRWQQQVRFGERRPFSEWLADVLTDGPPTPSLTSFMRHHDLPLMVERWSHLAGPDNMTVIVAREGDRSFLPAAFEGLLGLPDGLLVEAARRVMARPASVNDSLGWSEAELVRRLHVAADEAGWSRHERRGVVRLGVARAIRRLPPEERDRSTPALPGWAIGRIMELSEQRRQAVASSGVHIVGDLDDLIPPDGASTSTDADPSIVSLSLAVSSILTAVSAARGASTSQTVSKDED